MWADETMEIPPFEYEEPSAPSPLDTLLSPVANVLRDTFGLLGSSVQATGDAMRKSFSAANEGLKRTLSGFDKEAAEARRVAKEQRRKSEAAIRLQSVHRGSRARLLAAQMAAAKAALATSPAPWLVFVLNALGCGQQPA
jgi:hypothetical protein